MKEQHVLFGISPFNSKFDKNYLKRMLGWGFSHYHSVDILHPYEEASYLLIGCGDKAIKAKKKSRKEFYRIEKVIKEYQQETCNALCCERILKFADFYNNRSYKSILEKIRMDYKNKKEFYDICREQSYKAIMQRKKSVNNHNIVTKQQIDIATEYVIREMPFLIAPSAILSTEESIHISYYCTWPVADYLYSNKLSLTPFPGTKIVIQDHCQQD